MTNVVSLKPEPPRIWICECGCSTFSLCEDGTALCANCEGEIVGAGGWKTPPSDAPEFSGQDFEDIQGNGSVEFARHRVARLASSDDAVGVIVIRECGTIHAWSSAEALDRRHWLRRRIAEAWQLIRDAGR